MMESDYDCVDFSIEKEKIKYIHYTIIDAGNPIEYSDIGYKYHIAIFEDFNNNLRIIKDEFEAIIGDPIGYVNNLRGRYIYGSMVKKCKNTHIWWDKHIKRTVEFTNEYNIEHNRI